MSDSFENNFRARIFKYISRNYVRVVWVALECVCRRSPLRGRISSLLISSAAAKETSIENNKYIMLIIIPAFWEMEKNSIFSYHSRRGVSPYPRHVFAIIDTRDIIYNRHVYDKCVCVCVTHRLRALLIIIPRSGEEERTYLFYYIWRSTAACGIKFQSVSVRAHLLHHGIITAWFTIFPFETRTRDQSSEPELTLTPVKTLKNPYAVALTIFFFFVYSKTRVKRSPINLDRTRRNFVI